MGINIFLSFGFPRRPQRNEPTDFQRERIVDQQLMTLLAGYNQVEEEKRLFKTALVAAGTVLVVGSATASAALIEQGKWELVFFFPLGQIPLVAVAAILHLWSVGLTAHALDIEMQLDELLGKRLLHWEHRWFTSTPLYKRGMSRRPSKRLTPVTASLADLKLARATKMLSMSAVVVAFLFLIAELWTGYYYASLRWEQVRLPIPFFSWDVDAEWPLAGLAGLMVAVASGITWFWYRSYRGLGDGMCEILDLFETRLAESRQTEAQRRAGAH